MHLQVINASIFNFIHVMKNTLVRISLRSGASRIRKHQFESKLAKLREAGIYVIEDRALPTEKKAYIISTSTNPKELIASRVLLTLNRSLTSRIHQ
jgi:hypothetical protein